MKLRTAAILAASLTAALVPQAATAAPAAARCSPAGRGQDSFCDIRGVRIHYVDWGGDGRVVILLTGLGDSARIFDDLAPRLTQNHHVLAFTRRGYGLSDHDQTDYSNGALVADILGVMDALSIPRASFVGHSIAGGELSALGARHPDRVERLVYLDSAYDRTGALQMTKKVPPTPGPSEADRASIDAMARWREAALGVHNRAVRENLADTARMESGLVVSRTPPKVMLEVLAGDVAAKPDYAAIPAPALAIYSSKDVAEQISPATPPGTRQAVVDYATHVIRPWMLRAQAEFLERKRCGVATELPHSTHYFFLKQPAWTAKAILDFLAAPDPCHWSPLTVPQNS